MTKTIGLIVILFALTSAAMADVCVGNCGILGANGVVTTAPTGNPYRWISTAGGAVGAGVIAGVGGTDGSSYTSSVFTANSGDLLQFYFDYVTSDGAGFADYAWAELETAANAHVAWLFTARTEPSGNISPGLGLPDNQATLIPPTSGIIGGGPVWAPLGAYSGFCYSAGCGYTGWIESQYTLAAGGSYQLVFGVTNWIDNIYDSGMAFDGATIGGTPINPTVPEPGAWILLVTAGAGLSLARRRRAAR
jgi:hypothetical protein